MAFDSTKKIEKSSSQNNTHSSLLVSLNSISTPKSNSRNKSTPKSISISNPPIQSNQNSPNPTNPIQTLNPVHSFTDLPNALICEILKCLDPKGLSLISCVSTHLNSLVYSHYNWQKFYFDQWGSPPFSLEASSPKWKETFLERQFRTKSFMGKFSIDSLNGHTEPVRTVCILKSSKLVFTGGYDCTVRMWDLEGGFCLGASRSLGCTVRAIKADLGLLIAAGTGAFVHCWRAVEGNPNLFDLSGSKSRNGDDILDFEFRLWGHDGPITCLDLDGKNIYSGSWDMTVRVYDRVSRKCVMKMSHNDWVWAIAPRGGTLAVTAGSDLYVWRISTGEPVQLVQDAHKGDNIYSLARTSKGDLVFSGGADGTIHMYDLGNLNSKGDLVICAKWAPHSGAVNSLSFEFPWLVSCSNDGRISLIDIRKLLINRNNNCTDSRGRIAVNCSIEPPHRMLHGFGRDLFAVDLGFERIVCAGEEGAVRVWDFSEALERERRAEASRRNRVENRMRRKKAQLEMSSGNLTGGNVSHCPVVKSGVIRGSSKKGNGGKLKG